MPNRLGRRSALVTAALVCLPQLGRAQTGDISVGDAQIPTDGDAVAGVYAKPTGSGPFPIVLVAENGAGLDRVVTDACRDLAKEGFFAVAPALFAGDPADGILLRRLDRAAAWAAERGGDRGRLGIIGFGPGGRLAWLYDAYSPVLKAAVVWSAPIVGRTAPDHPMTPLDATPDLHAPLLGLYGKNDGTARSVLLDAEAKAKRAGKTVEIVAYVGAGANFAVPDARSFDQAAALDGWQRTVAWLRTHIKL